MFLGLVHPPPTEKLNRELAPGYALSKSQLEQTVPMLLQRPITVEHHGVFDAVKHASDETHSIPLPDSVTEAMHALSKTDELSAIVGNVEDAFQVPSSGALYVVYSIDEKFASSIEFLILNKMMAGLSMTHMVSKNTENGIVPYEVKSTLPAGTVSLFNIFCVFRLHCVVRLLDRGATHLFKTRR